MEKQDEKTVIDETLAESTDDTMVEDDLELNLKFDDTVEGDETMASGSLNDDEDEIISDDSKEELSEDNPFASLAENLFGSFFGEEGKSSDEPIKINISIGDLLENVEKLMSDKSQLGNLGKGLNPKDLFSGMNHMLFGQDAPAFGSETNDEENDDLNISMEDLFADVITGVYADLAKKFRPFIKLAPVVLNEGADDLTDIINVFTGFLLQIRENETFRENSKRNTTIKARKRFEMFEAYTKAGFSKNDAMKLVMLEMKKTTPNFSTAVNANKNDC